MGSDEFYERLKSMPLTDEGVGEFWDYIFSMDDEKVLYIFENENLLIDTLAKKVLEVKTLPEARAYVLLMNVVFSVMYS